MQLPVIDDDQLEKLLIRIRIVRRDATGELRYVNLEGIDPRRSFELHQCDLGDPADGLVRLGDLTIYSPVLFSAKQYHINLAELYAQLLQPIDPHSQQWVRKNGHLARAMFIPETFRIDYARNAMIINLTLLRE
ncbi:MAG: hypothetical protein AAB490_00315 [Patescibacteria group bacterium]